MRGEIVSMKLDALVHDEWVHIGSFPNDNDGVPAFSACKTTLFYEGLSVREELVCSDGTIRVMQESVVNGRSVESVALIGETRAMLREGRVPLSVWFGVDPSLVRCPIGA